MRIFLKSASHGLNNLVSTFQYLFGKSMRQNLTSKGLILRLAALPFTMASFHLGDLELAHLG